MIPTPLQISNDILRIYLSCLDSYGVGRTGFIDVSTKDPMRVLHVGQNPILDVGRPGSFDDNGATATSVLRTPDGQYFLYYVGFELCHHVRYRLLTGLAVSSDGERFERVQETPILERSSTELYFRCGPQVRYEDGCFRMLYVAGNSWTDVDGKPVPVYDIRSLESQDGIHWPTKGNLVLPVVEDDEHGFGRPYLFCRDRGFELFYSVRRRSLKAYRMGYAVSADGHIWTRHDEAFGLDMPLTGWDSQMACFGAPVTIGGQTWLFYNGNNFGETGIGVALRED